MRAARPWLNPGLVPAAAVIWGVNQWIEDVTLSLPLSSKEIHIVTNFEVNTKTRKWKHKISTVSSTLKKKKTYHPLILKKEK